MYTKKYFDNTDILYEIHPIKESKEFAIGAIEFSKQMDADLIIITVSRTITLADYLMGPSEQLFIANEAKIPVMVVNPKPKMLSGGFSATGT